MTDRYTELQQLAAQFGACFNRHDLDATMEFFTDDAVYEELHGPKNEGKTAIRAAFESLFARKLTYVIAKQPLYIETAA